MSYTLKKGDSLGILKQMPDNTLQCCVTSPPYWGLRDYGIDGQLGLEAAPDEYVAKLIDICREIRRVLKKDGTFWLNLGDCYAATMKGSGGTNPQVGGGKATILNGQQFGAKKFKLPIGLKPKDLVGIPWMVAFALRADGWYLRAEIIWHKRNPMPSSVKDRPTVAHEQIFLLTKSPKYFYDANAILEPCTSKKPSGNKGRMNSKGRFGSEGWSVDPFKSIPLKGRNCRSVWSLSSQPHKGAHFATFPPKLIEPCILAGSRIGDTVLDPFNGAGTTGLVALQHRRHYIGIDINPEYLDLTRNRFANIQPEMRLMGVSK